MSPPYPKAAISRDVQIQGPRFGVCSCEQRKKKKMNRFGFVVIK